MKPKIIILISLSVVIILTLAISFSYAIWISNNQQTGENIVKSGCLEITYEEDANSVISIENGYPISDEAGLETTPYTFKIKNTCSLYTEYNVNAEVLDNTTLSHEFLRIQLDNEASNIINTNQLIEETIETATSYNLNTFELAPEEEITHSFRMWIDKDTTTTDGNNKLVNLSITITAVVDKFVSFTQEFAYTGDSQEFIVPETEVYKIELWGASGGGTNNYGGYTQGFISLEKGNILYLYIGSSGVDYDTTTIGGYNGGGNSTKTTLGKSGSSGGGGTDIRISEGPWNNFTSLNSRIMVTAGGGGGIGGRTALAGGLIGYNGIYTVEYPTSSGYGGTQISGGKIPTLYPGATSNGTAGLFGIGGIGGQSTNAATTGGGSGGGGGYYGGSGASGLANTTWAGGGGSSFISGHTGAVAITSESDRTPKTGCTTGTTDIACSIHYSGYVFTDTVMIDGAGYAWTNVKGDLQQMPNPSGGYYELGVGHIGNGFAKITKIEN